MTRPKDKAAWKVALSWILVIALPLGVYRCWDNTHPEMPEGGPPPPPPPGLSMEGSS